MMAWEQPIMEKMAELCVSEGDDVLELGFGMGILSDAIQARKPKTHTIVECHKDVIPKLQTWANGKSNVIIIEGLWTEVRDQYLTYDAILQDTYADDHVHALKNYAETYGKENCKVSFWNSVGYTNNSVAEYLGFENVTYHDVTVSPPLNKYYNQTIYKVPLTII
jgi:protein arginine N-methyltransferase 2